MKMVKVCLYFHTNGNGLELTDDLVYDCGAVSVQANPKRGIKSQDPSYFTYFGSKRSNVESAIKEQLQKAEIMFVDPKEAKAVMRIKEKNEVC